VFDVKHYHLHVSLDIPSQSISGRNDIFLEAVSPFEIIQLDLFENMILDSVLLQGRKLIFSREGDAFFVHFPSTVKTKDTLTVSVYYKGRPVVSDNPPWSGGFVWEEDSLGRNWIGVACEGTGASLWWPNKDHLSDEPDSMLITIRGPESLPAISNGLLIHEQRLPEDMKEWTWRVTYPINNYNVTLNLAHYHHFSDIYRNGTDKALPLDYYVLDYNRDIAPSHFGQVKGMLECFEHYLGEFPFWNDGYTLVETPYWGMEHQSCIAYGNDFENNEYGFDYIIVHESAHEYWGNSVSTKDHGELWIHESFATYMESLYMEYFHGRDSAQYYMNEQRKTIYNLKPILGPLHVNFNEWTDADMYYKGSWMLHSIRNMVADDSLWFSMIRSLYQEFKYKTVSTVDVVDFMDSMTVQDLQPVFRQFLTTTDIPRLVIRKKFTRNGLKLKYRWARVVKDFNMPVIARINENERITLYPSTRRQKIVLPVFSPENFELDTDLFYYELAD
jgi:aminopeptidase N